MRRHKLKTDQNIFDLAIQETGSIEGVLDIIKDNTIVANINHIFSFGDTVLIQETPKDVNIQAYFANRPKLFVSTTEEEINGDFNDDFDYDYSGGDVTGFPPVIVAITFKTESNVPVDTFDPSFITINGELVTFTLIGGYVETTNSLSIAARSGLSGTPSTLDASELDGTCQDVVAAFSTDTPANVTEIDFNNDFICEILDLTLLTNAHTFIFNNNSGLTSVIFPSNSTVIQEIDFDSCGLVSVDISPLLNIGGSIKFSNNSITTVIHSASSNPISRFDFANCNLTGAFDFSDLTAVGGIIDFRNNSLLTGLIFGASTELQQTWQINSTSIVTLDLSVFTRAPNTLRLTSNSNLTSVLFPSSSDVVQDLRVTDGDITGTLNIGTMSQVGGFISIKGNPNMTGVTNPVASTTSATTYRVENCDISSLDLSGFLQLGGDIRMSSNTSLNSLTLPASSINALTNFAANNCDLPYFDITNFATSNGVTIALQDNSMTAGEVDNFLSDLVASGWTGGTLMIDGTNASPTGGASNADYITLTTTQSWIVTIS